MRLPNSESIAAKLIWCSEAGSTNTELIELAKGQSLPDFTVMATANQVAGRGRAGRTWQAPANTSLAISVLLRPRLDNPADVSKLGWLPLLGGLAMAENVSHILGHGEGIGVKWPNDVLVSERKICGVLSELVPLQAANGLGGTSVAVVIGAGINLTLTDSELPVPTATSLALAGASLPESLDERIDLVLSGYLARLHHWYQKFTDARLSASASGLRSAVQENCVTLGREVRAMLPGGTDEVGQAVGIDENGRLVMEIHGKPFEVAAGDIVHLRHN